MAMWGADSTGAEVVKGDGVPLLRRVGGLLTELGEQEGHRLTVWAPLLLVCGIWSYFALTREPPLALPVILIVVAAVLLWRKPGSLMIRLICIIAAGFVLAQVRTHWVATPLLRAYVPQTQIEGRVADVDRRSARRAELVVDVISASGLPDGERPRRLRLDLFGGADLPKIGDRISGTARLFPNPMPVSPGSFDFGRSLFFQSIGGTGSFKGGIVINDDPAPLRYQLRRSFHALRGLIGMRIRSVIEGPLGSFADALITGERAQIPRSMNDSLQASGLFHILSISGLHMALVAGGAFWFIRALLALSPTLALTRPIKAWAAGAALLVALFYMLLADSGAATERSFIMVAIVLFAVMVNRPALSLHNLAIAAIFILVLAPEQAVAASFQMSFLAVMGLAAFFEWWNGRAAREYRPGRGWVARGGRWLVLLVIASLLTSLIAGGLSGIAAAHHFGRIAPYGIAANALALPVVSLVVMPSALAATLLMPLGLDYPFLWAMGRGLEVVMWISDWVASWPHASLTLPLLPAPVAAALALAAAFACMAQSALRWLCIPALVLAAVFGATRATPDLLIDERARTVAARDAGRHLVPLDVKARYLPVTRWLREAGQPERVGVAAKRALWNCTGSVCSAEVRGKRVTFLQSSAELAKPCPRSDILIAQYPLRRSCRGALLTVDRFDVWRHGAYAVFIAQDVSVETVRGTQGYRPWTWQPRSRRAGERP